MLLKPGDEWGGEKKNKPQKPLIFPLILISYFNGFFGVGEEGGAGGELLVSVLISILNRLRDIGEPPLNAVAVRPVLRAGDQEGRGELLLDLHHLQGQRVRSGRVHLQGLRAGLVARR